MEVELSDRLALEEPAVPVRDERLLRFRPVDRPAAGVHPALPPPRPGEDAALHHLLVVRTVPIRHPGAGTAAACVGPPPMERTAAIRLAGASHADAEDLGHASALDPG